ncbi:hypothetical protein J0X15_15820 [Roseibium sp. CAU 1637]|uniref:Uncharacterized protein n=1 Tax=Roseibium limicola TaxID=2816037 RepID=A0A939ERN3_9HYPH|nr:hypothetical protein [Roseibium limicola]MBO0346696.1 hypothetical protein [Roseibium limicola]
MIDYNEALALEAASAIKKHADYNGDAVSHEAFDLACECLAGAIENYNMNDGEYSGWFDGSHVVETYSENFEGIEGFSEEDYKAAEKQVGLGLQTLIAESETEEAA